MDPSQGEPVSTRKKPAVVQPRPDVTLVPVCTSVSIQGGRSKNEDTAEYMSLEDSVWGPTVFCMVADGHGGASVSKMLKRETLATFQRHFEAEKSDNLDTSTGNLDLIMESVLRTMNRELQSYCQERSLSGGSTLVAVFAFLNYERMYVLNVGDSRFILFDVDTGEICQTVHRVVDFEDDMERDFPPDDLHPSHSHLHKVLGKIKIKNNPVNLKSMEGKAGTWNAEFAEYLTMANDTPDRRGLREYVLFLNNSETNSPQAVEFVNHRANDEELVISHRQLPSTTRAFGDIGMTLHMGEIYICSIPTDVETAIFVGCDGFEESIRYSLIPKYLSNPQAQINSLLSADHKFVAMYRQYKDWFIHQRIGTFPQGGILHELNWLLRCVNLVGHSHLPSTRDCEVIAGAVQWLQWAYNKYSNLGEDDPNNKFHKPFRESARFRLKFLVQCALARLSSDNISGVVIDFTPS